MGQQIHDLGLGFGVYSDAGIQMCMNGLPNQTGSLGMLSTPRISIRKALNQFQVMRLSMRKHLLLGVQTFSNVSEHALLCQNWIYNLPQTTTAIQMPSKAIPMLHILRRLP